MRGHVCLLTTFQSLLRVTLDERFRLQEVRTLDSGRGIYFGLTRGEREVFVVARNIDVHKRVINPELPTNAILSLDPDADGPGPAAWTLPEFADLHQIRYRDGLLWVVNGRDPELVAADPVARRCVGAVSLGSLVPAELRHEALPQHPGDPYHFNSLHFGRRHLWLLAHNWSYGSFALELEYAGPESLLRKPRVSRIMTRLGYQCHDLLAEGKRLYMLDGQGSRLVTSDQRTGLVGTGPLGASHFPRGLAAGEQFFFVGSGANSRDREGRDSGPSYLTVLDRRSLEVVASLDVGPFGNTCGLLLLSEPDATDCLPPRSWLRRLPFVGWARGEGRWRRAA
jgi:hypothetical protein